MIPSPWRTTCQTVPNYFLYKHHKQHPCSIPVCPTGSFTTPYIAKIHHTTDAKNRTEERSCWRQSYKRDEAKYLKINVVAQPAVLDEDYIKHRPVLITLIRLECQPERSLYCALCRFPLTRPGALAETLKRTLIYTRLQNKVNRHIVKNQKSTNGAPIKNLQSLGRCHVSQRAPENRAWYHHV